AREGVLRSEGQMGAFVCRELRGGKMTRPTRKRSRLRGRDKVVWILARRFLHEWRRHLVVVRPETVVAWHRRGWRLFWWCRSRCRVGRPRLSAEVRDLIATLAQGNPR